jgi:pantoate--beta-alanine ligase
MNYTNVKIPSVPFSILNKKQELINIIASLGKTVGFVPTMGALHDGHKHLIQKSASENDITVVSIFVNPKQFGPREDFAKYPRQISEDAKICENAGATILFAPSVNEMYPEGFNTSVCVEGMDSVLCGSFRPGHFTGVATIVLLLLNLVKPHKAYFGKKDYQQLAMISKMAHDLALPTEICGVETLRDKDKLALSSRNVFLEQQDRKEAANIPKALGVAAKLYLDGEKNTGLIVDKVKVTFAEANLVPQYIQICDAQTLVPVQNEIQDSQEVVLAIACIIGGVRLIDNILLGKNQIENLKKFLGESKITL